METPKFIERFADYVCGGDTISVTLGSITYTAKIERDVDANLSDYDPEIFRAEDRRAWRNDEWFFCGIVISATMQVDVPGCIPQAVIISNHAASLWSIDANLPNNKGKTSSAYLNDVANELLPEAIEHVQTVMSKICAEFCVAAQNKQAAANT